MLNEKFRKTVTGPLSGQEFVIRKVRPTKFASALGVLPVVVNGDIGEQLKQFSDDLRAKAEVDPLLEDTATRFLLENGVVSPRIWFGEETLCPEDEVCFGDLGGDCEFLVQQVISYSYDFQAMRNLAKFFRVDGAGNSGFSGTTLLDETIGTVSGNGIQKDEPSV